MARHDLSDFRHVHAFDDGNVAGERRLWIVVAITAVTMVAEIVGGWITGSMALTADGWHMGTHVAALGIAAISYRLARQWSSDARFTFGTWKTEVLGAYSSALLLAVVAVAMVVESIRRLVSPEPIDYVPALVVALVGLVVNLASALLLGGHDHGHGHAHGGDAGHRHGDLNLRSAYVHVLADAFTSVLAIAALAAGLYAGWAWLDPAMGIVGAVVIGWWAKGLIAESSRVLLDREMDSPVVADVRRAIECDGDAEIADLHVWRVGRERYACALTIVAREPLEAAKYRARLGPVAAVAHASIEIHRCPHYNCP
ncbi:MAG: CDF family Co(II)/Ni(II) efflux transporter DmeF [Betaproteobacteria bacterium]|nr:CDF family Co(II)/Ni(II) efflux transporter DmeF [Betaproteobacteria bacterium]